MQDNLQAAKECLDKAAELAPENVAVQVALGDYFCGRGNYEQATFHAKEALRIEPQSSSANVLMGEVQLALGNSNDADYHAKFALTQNPNSSNALSLFANIRMRKNWFMGGWWRFNNWVATLGQQRSVLVLIGAFLTFNVLSEVAEIMGY